MKAQVILTRLENKVKRCFKNLKINRKLKIEYSRKFAEN